MEKMREMNVSYSDNHLIGGFYSTDKNIDIHFFPCGVNQIFAIGKVDYFASLATHKNNEPIYEFFSGTDWIGPYFVCQIKNKSKDIPRRFTGGWHGSNGDGTGNPTACTNKVVITVDGKQINSEVSKKCESFSIQVVNLIQGYDTTSTKVLLEESVNYQLFPDRTLHIRVDITALDDVVIHRYYGMQSQNFSIFNSVSYSTREQIINSESIEKNSCCVDSRKINIIQLNDSIGQYQLKLILDTSKGLGTFKYLADHLPRAFSADYRKSYFNLINGRELILKKGASVFWQGTYVFD